MRPTSYLALQGSGNCGRSGDLDLDLELDGGFDEDFDVHDLAPSPTGTSRRVLLCWRVAAVSSIGLILVGGVAGACSLFHGNPASWRRHPAPARQHPHETLKFFASAADDVGLRDLLQPLPSSKHTASYISMAGPEPERLGLFRNSKTDKCLTLTSSEATPDLQACRYQTTGYQAQEWVVKSSLGELRSMLGSNLCLDAEGHPGWKAGTPIQVAQCWPEGSNVQDTDQRWKFDAGGYIVSRVSGKCLGVRSEDEVLILETCNFTSNETAQRWSFINVVKVAETAAEAQGRTHSAILTEHLHRVSAALSSSESSPRLILQDVEETKDGLKFSDGHFWNRTAEVFKDMSPTWHNWSEVFKIAETAQNKDYLEGNLGAFILTNLVSNMLFADMNLVQGFQRPDVAFSGGGDSEFRLRAIDFGDEMEPHGCSPTSGTWTKPLALCLWPQPMAGAKVGIVSFQEYILEQFGVKLPAHTFFESLYIGKTVPPWEDDAGRQEAFRMLGSAMSSASMAGFKPMEVVRSNWDARFAFDAVGLSELQNLGFGFGKSHGSTVMRGSRTGERQATSGLESIVALDRLLAKYGNTTDILGVVLSDTVLSMHLSFDADSQEFVVDLSYLESYKPLPGFAKLGGRAVLAERNGRLATVSLEYAGKKYSGLDFEDAEVEEDYEHSKLSGWRFAEKAIIASLLAKTQLLTHFRTIHLELAPALQAVTIDTLPVNHALRRLLMPFTSRGIQATTTNLQLWFEMRLAEFGLAPLPVEEQLKLLHETMESSPLNLADLDMDNFAQSRNMGAFSDSSREGWKWTWHIRASEVEKKLDNLVDCWLDQYYEGSDAMVAADDELAAWWSNLIVHVPSLRVALWTNKDWVGTQAPTTPKPPTTTTKGWQPPPSPSYDPIPMPNYFGSEDSSETIPEENKIVTVWPAAPPPPPPTPAPTPAPTQPPTPVPPAAGKDQPLFYKVTDLHPDEPSTGATNWRRLSSGLPVPDLASLRRTLRTFMLWTSWIHEDVGHGMAHLFYNPVHTPMVVPEDGQGISLSALAITTAAYRNFVFLERATLLDDTPESWFTPKTCQREFLVMEKCWSPIKDKQCYADFQEALRQLGAVPAEDSSSSSSSSSTAAKKKEEGSNTKPYNAFLQCGTDGFFSCVEDVETSASS